MNENGLPQRKGTRLRNFDYSTTGAYFITICVRDRMRILSEIVSPNLTIKSNANDFTSVGEGLGPPAVRLTKIGKIVEQQLILIEKRYYNLTIDEYIIMPDHIHILFMLRNVAGGASPSPTVHDVICAFKSLTSRICKKQFGIEQIFQRSCADHVIRDRKDYEIKKRYIYENPMKWYYNKERDCNGLWE